MVKLLHSLMGSLVAIAVMVTVAIVYTSKWCSDFHITPHFLFVEETEMIFVENAINNLTLAVTGTCHSIPGNGATNCQT